MKTPGEYLKKLSRQFEGYWFLKKLKSYIRILGVQTIYTVLLLYFAYQQSDTPGWAKKIILGGFAYLLAPIDVIPDLTPFLGFTDDLGILLFGLVSIAGYVNEEVKVKAKSLIDQWFEKIDPNDLAEIDKKI